MDSVLPHRHIRTPRPRIIASWMSMTEWKFRLQVYSKTGRVGAMGSQKEAIWLKNAVGQRKGRFLLVAKKKDKKKTII